MIKELFAPTPVLVPERGWFDHVKNYVDTSEGSQALFELTARVFEVIHLSAKPLSHMAAVAAKAQRVFAAADSSLDLPGVVLKPCAFAKSAIAVAAPSPYTANTLPRRAMDCFRDGALMVRAYAGAALFGSASSLYMLSKIAAFRLNVVGITASLLADGADLARDCIVLAREDHRDETALLALTNVVKNVASVAIGVLLLAGLGFSNFAASSAYVGTLLTIGFIYSAARISSYFVDKMLVDERLVALA